jgi:hypothetical protein
MVATKGLASIAMADVELTKHRGNSEFVHYVNVVVVRTEVMKLLLSDKLDAKAQLDQYIEKLTAQERNCLPVNDPALMHILGEVNASILLQSKSADEINDHREGFLSKVNVAESILTALDAARKDLERAEKNRINAEERSQKKHVQQAIKSEACASKAAAKRGAAFVASAAKGSSKDSIFDINLNDESFCTPKIFDNTLQLTSDLADGSVPYIVHECPELAELLKEPGVKAALDLFLPQCAASKPVKLNGRGQRPAAPLNKMDEFQQKMLLGAPFADVFVPDSCQD